MIKRIDTEQLKAAVDIMTLVETDLGSCTSQSGDWSFWSCPFHEEHTPSFSVNRRTQSWCCYGCKIDGDVIGWVMKYREIDFLKACSYLEGIQRETVPATSVPVTGHRRTGSQAVKIDQWQHQGLALVERSEKNLVDPSGGLALDWLRKRGLTHETIKAARLGFNTKTYERREAWGLTTDGNLDKVLLNQGIIIPWFSQGRLRRIIIRLITDPHHEQEADQKYKVLPGSVNTLYNEDRLNGSQPVVLVEGVFDALSIQQMAGDLVTTVATGNTSGAQTPDCIDRLKAAPLVLVAFDADDAGDRGSTFWLKTLPNAKRWRPINFKDPSEMLERGMDLRRWLQPALTSR